MAGTIKRLVHAAERRPRDAIAKWKDYLHNIKNKGLFDALRAKQLQDCLNKIPSRILKDGFERITGNGNKLAGAIRRLVLAAERKPKEALQKWRKYIDDIKSKGIFDALRARQLKDCLGRIPVRTLRDGYDRITGDGNKLAGAIRRFIHAAERKPREAMKKWRDWVSMSKNQGLLNALKARQLKECLEKIPARILRDAYDRVTGDGSKLAGAIRRVMLAAERRPREAF